MVKVAGPDRNLALGDQQGAGVSVIKIDEFHIVLKMILCSINI